MKKRLLIVSGIIITIVIAVVIVWTPLRLDRFGFLAVAIDWIDVVKLNDQKFKANNPRQEVLANEIDHKIGDIQFTLSEQVSNPNYKMRNGDATFLPEGTLIFSINNDNNSVAALIDGKYYRFTKND
jgi:hypothetical protein